MYIYERYKCLWACIHFLLTSNKFKALSVIVDVNSAWRAQGLPHVYAYDMCLAIREIVY